MGGINAQDDVLAGLKDTEKHEIIWRPGQRNFTTKAILLDGERYLLFKGLHRFDGVVALRIAGDVRNDQRNRDMVAHVLSEMAEAVRLGHVRFE